MSPSLTRRRFLARSGTALLVAGTATTSGCTEALPPLGNRVRYGRVDVPDPATGPVYRRWLPAESALPPDLDPGYVNAVAPQHLGHAAAGVTNRDPHFFQKPYLDYFGLGYEQYDSVLKLHRTTRPTFVLEGDIDTATVADTLAASGYAAAGTNGEYDLFERADSPRTAAVGPNAIVWAHHDRSTAVVAAVLDAARGTVAHHHETDEAFARLTDATGATPWTMLGGLGIDPTGAALARSMAYSVDADGVYYTFNTLYPPGQVVSEHGLKDALEQHSRAVNGRAVDVRVDDRSATVEIRLDHGVLRTDYATATVPQITWGVTRETGRLTVRHAAGETTPADTITLATERDSERTPTETQFADSTDRIRPGTAVTLDVADLAGTKRLLGTFSPRNAQRSCTFVVAQLP